jgi:hypothetical protein
MDIREHAEPGIADVHIESSMGKPFSKVVSSMPFGGYKDFASCVAANQDKENPEAYCGQLKSTSENAENEFPPMGSDESLEMERAAQAKASFEGSLNEWRLFAAMMGWDSRTGTSKTNLEENSNWPHLNMAESDGFEVVKVTIDRIIDSVMSGTGSIALAADAMDQLKDIASSLPDTPEKSAILGYIKKGIDELERFMSSISLNSDGEKPFFAGPDDHMTYRGNPGFDRSYVVWVGSSSSPEGGIIGGSGLRFDTVHDTEAGSLEDIKSQALDDIKQWMNNHPEDGDIFTIEVRDDDNEKIIFKRTQRFEEDEPTITSSGEDIAKDLARNSNWPHYNMMPEGIRPGETAHNLDVDIWSGDTKWGHMIGGGGYSFPARTHTLRLAIEEVKGEALLDIKRHVELNPEQADDEWTVEIRSQPSDEVVFSSTKRLRFEEDEPEMTLSGEEIAKRFLEGRTVSFKEDESRDAVLRTMITRIEHAVDMMMSGRNTPRDVTDEVGRLRDILSKAQPDDPLLGLHAWLDKAEEAARDLSDIGINSLNAEPLVASFAELHNVPIFRVGTHTDSAGVARGYTRADIEFMVNSFNDKTLSSVPAKIGHTSDEFNDRISIALGVPSDLIHGEGPTNKGALRVGHVHSLSLSQDGDLSASVQLANDRVASLVRDGYFNAVSPELRITDKGPILGALSFLGAQRPALASNHNALVNATLLDDGKVADAVYQFEDDIASHFAGEFDPIRDVYSVPRIPGRSTLGSSDTLGDTDVVYSIPISDAQTGAVRNVIHHRAPTHETAIRDVVNALSQGLREFSVTFGRGAGVVLVTLLGSKLLLGKGIVRAKPGQVVDSRISMIEKVKNLVSPSRFSEDWPYLRHESTDQSWPFIQSKFEEDDMPDEVNVPAKFDEEAHYFLPLLAAGAAVLGGSYLTNSHFRGLINKALGGDPGPLLQAVRTETGKVRDQLVALLTANYPELWRTIKTSLSPAELSEMELGVVTRFKLEQPLKYEETKDEEDKKNPFAKKDEKDKKEKEESVDKQLAEALHLSEHATRSDVFAAITKLQNDAAPKFSEEEFTSLKNQVRVAHYERETQNLVISGTPLELATKLASYEERLGEAEAVSLLDEWKNITTQARETGLMKAQLSSREGASNIAFMEMVNKYQEANPAETRADAVKAMMKAHPGDYREYAESVRTTDR